MFAFPEQFSNATKVNLESQFSLFSALASKTFEGMEKLVELNISTAKATLENSSAAARQLLAVKDPQEFFAVTTSQAQPNAEKALAYSRQVASIAADTGAEFSRAAETQFAESDHRNYNRDGSAFDVCETFSGVDYATGVEAAVDTLLLRQDADAARALCGWTPPRLPLSGGALVARGLTAGPLVAKALRQVEDRWIAEDFPAQPRVEAIADAVVGAIIAQADEASSGRA